MNQSSPLRRAITAYWPILPCSTLVSSQTVGQWSKNSSSGSSPITLPDSQHARHLAGNKRPVVPVEKLPRAVEADRLGQLVGVRGLHVHALVVVADRVVGGAGEHPREERWSGTSVGLAFLVAANALLGHQVRIGPRPARRAVLIVDIDHQLVFGGLANGIVQPSGPFLRADVDEAELDAFHAPLADRAAGVRPTAVPGPGGSRTG